MPVSLPPLTVSLLQKEAKKFAKAESAHAEPSLFGVTDGKAIGTYLEHKFQTELLIRYAYPKPKAEVVRSRFISGFLKRDCER